MIIKNVAVLSFLFIFGIITPLGADSVKSINNAANQETIMKMNENRIAMRKKTGSVKKPVKPSKKRKARFPPSMSYPDYEAIIGNTRPDVNFLKTLEEKKPRLTDSLDILIYSYKFSQNAWREKFLNLMEVAEAKSSNPDFNQSMIRPYQTGNKYFEEGRILETFKLLQSRREEIPKEIFMGFCLSYNPIRGHMFLEMNVTPSEKGQGFIIPF